MLKALNNSSLKTEIYEIVDQDLIPVIQSNLDSLRENIRKAVKGNNGIITQFKEINDINISEISKSIKEIDETKDIEAENEKFAIEKREVDKIAKASSGFLQIWDMVERG